MERQERTRREDQGWRKYFPQIVTIGIFLANILIVLIGKVYVLSYNNLQTGIQEVKVMLAENRKTNDSMQRDIQDLAIKYTKVRYQCCSEVKSTLE